MAAAKGLANVSPAAHDPNGNLMPPVASLREVALEVARAVALQAQQEGLAAPSEVATTLNDQIKRKLWAPGYTAYTRVFA